MSYHNDFVRRSRELCLLYGFQVGSSPRELFHFIQYSRYRAPLTQARLARLRECIQIGGLQAHRDRRTFSPRDYPLSQLSYVSDHACN